MAKQFSFPPEKIKVLFLEGIHPAAADRMRQSGYQTEMIKAAYSEDELCKAIGSVHILGIRSKTSVTGRVLEHA
jgi:D-3-phosphoglycerate dehydrogenase